MMWNRETKDVQNIQSSEIVRKCTISGNTVSFRIQNAMIGTVDGKRVLLDEIVIDEMLKQMVRAANAMPKEIIIRNGNAAPPASTESQQEQSKDTEQQIIESWDPRFTLEQVALNENVRQQIRTAISAVRYRTKLSEEWGLSEHFAGNRAIILNFYGKAGTGKSMTAEAIAQALGKKVYRISYAELESKYVGETPKNIRKAFALATKDDALRNRLITV